MSSNGTNYKYKNLLRKHIRSYKYAFRGLASIFLNQFNFQIELMLAVLAFAASLAFRISKIEFIIIFFAVIIVLIAEALNSAIEAVCDAVMKEMHHEIKYAKDIAAGAVLLSAFAAVVMGLIVFVPYITEAVENF